jgi:hypothetical protein
MHISVKPNKTTIEIKVVAFCGTKSLSHMHFFRLPKAVLLMSFSIL